MRGVCGLKEMADFFLVVVIGEFTLGEIFRGTIFCGESFLKGRVSLEVICLPGRQFSGSNLPRINVFTF